MSVTMNIQLRVVEPKEIDDILEYENRKLKEMIADDMEREIASWSARWRKEALEHYLPMGWSFVAREILPTDNPQSPREGAIVGYFLAQPLLFFEGQTQSLWVEHLQFSSLQARDELCDLAYRLSREKHFQKVYFKNETAISNSVKTFKPEEWKPDTLVIRTSKAST